MALQRVKSRLELFRLRERARVVREGNLIADIGKPFYVYSPFSDTRYASEVTENTDWGLLESYIADGNVYVLCDD